RVRRKLMLSYVFVGFFPATLIVVFLLLCGFLLFYNFSSYLVQSHLRALSDQASFLAQGTALEIQRTDGRDIPGIIERRQANATGEMGGVSIAVRPAERACAGGSGQTATPPRVITAGPWAHVNAPAAIPTWIDCAGVSGV